MAKIELSQDQLKAVNETGHNILVKASAGSGKTFVLIKRLMKRIVVDRISIDQIVAMTFTDAASIEMRNRLSKAMKEEIANQQALGHQDEVAYLNLQLAKLVDAKITTIHSFCLDITKQYYYLVGITKNTCSNLIDESTAKEVKHLFLKQIFNQQYRDNRQVFSELAYQTGCSTFSFDKLESAVDLVLNHANETADPIAWLEDHRYQNEINSIDDVNQTTLQYLTDEIQSDLAEFIRVSEEISKLDYYADDAKFKARTEELKKLQSIDDYQTLVQALYGKLIVPRKSKKGAPEFDECVNQTNALAESIVSKLVPCAIIVNLEKQIKPLNNLLIDITEELYNRYQEYKQKHEYIDFADFEHYAYRILTMDDYRIAKILKTQYREIMIDEFQDTNDIQYKMAELISDNNLFLVGDVKQSIYRFRGAKPSIMESLSHNPEFCVIHLKDNYRSKRNIVDFNNKLFNELMNIKVPGTFTVDDAQNANLENQSKDNHEIIFRAIQPENDKEKLADAKLEKTHLLAEWIVDLVRNQGLKFKDICILVRVNTEMTLIKKVLDEYNIPCFCKDNEGYFRSYIIEVLTSYLELLIDPDNRIALVSVLSSCLYNYSDDDLVKLASDNYKLNDEEFEQDYQTLKEYLDQNDLMGLINYFIQIKDIYNTTLDIQERSNIDLLITKLQTYHIANGEELVKFIKDTSDTMKDKAYSISKEDDVVRITTIHGSKGLQYNTVILYSKNRNTAQSSTSNINISDEFGIGFHITRSQYGDTFSSLAYVANHYLDKIEDLNENLRVLYVALTRAEQRLYFVDADFKGKEKTYLSNIGLFLKNRTFTPLILGARKRFDCEGNFKFEEVTSLSQSEPFDLVEPPKNDILKYTKAVQSLEEATPSKLSHKDIKLELVENLGLDIGTRMHYVMEKLDFNHVSRDAILEIDDGLTESQVDNLLATFDDPVFKDAIKYDYHREYPFYYVKDNHNIHGIIDFVSFADDHIILIDYKTDRLETKEEFVERYHEQLEAYQQVLTESFKLPVQTYIYSFHLQTSIKLN